MERERSTGAAAPSSTGKRPVLLSLLCLTGFVYFLVLSVLLVIAVFYSGWISEVTNKYAPVRLVSPSKLLLIFLGAALLHMVSFAGLVLIWKLKKTGYYLLSIPCFLIACYFLLLPEVSPSTVIIYILFIFAYGFYYRRLG
jgi:hypothetical protein